MSFIHQAKINDVNYDIIGSCYYGTSATAAGTAAKVATVSNADGFVLVPGVQVAIKFTTSNSASSPTLNVNSTGAKTIKYRGAAITSSAYYWAANQVVTFVYDGEAWQTTDYLKNPNSDTKATTTLTTTNGSYPVILKYTTTATDSPTTTLRYSSGVTVNPSVGSLTAKSLTAENGIFDTVTAGSGIFDDIEAGLVNTGEIAVASADSLQNISISPQSLDVKGSSLEEKVSISSAGIEMVNSSGNASALYTDTGAGRGAWLAQGTTVYHPGVSGTLALTTDIPTITTGTANGTISVGGTNVSVQGLGSNAYSSTTYAGGTKVTLNGSSKGGSTASFYAPTSAGTKDYILVSNGSGAPVWAAASTLKTGSVPQRYSLTATAGQTSFSIPFDYDSSASNLTVYHNGILLKDTDNYTVNTTNNTINLAGYSAEAGDIITVMGLIGVAGVDIGDNIAQGLVDIENALASAQTAISSAQNTAISAVNSAKNTATTAVNSAKTTAINEINTIKTDITTNSASFMKINATNTMGASGKITMNSAYAPSGNYDLTTKTYVDNRKAFHVGTSAPSNTNLLWIDTSTGNGVLTYHNGSAWKRTSSVWA